MFGKTKDVLDTTIDGPDLDAFFGDEAAADTGVQLETLRDRVRQVEGQVNSQFTSLAAYAQIAQEQVELVRAEARSETVRTEGRVTELIERERSDRLGTAPHSPGFTGVTTDVEARLEALEHAVASIRVGIDDCLSRQKALADAITSLFEPHTMDEPATLPPPVIDGPIGGLAMHG